MSVNATLDNHYNFFPRELKFDEVKRVIENLREKRNIKQKEYDDTDYSARQIRHQLEQEIHKIEGEIKAFNAINIHLLNLKKLEDEFYLKESDESSTVDIYRKGVNMFKGEEQPIGCIENIDFGSITIMIDQVELEPIEWGALLNMIEQSHKRKVPNEYTIKNRRY